MKRIFLSIVLSMLVQLICAQSSSTFIPKVNNIPSSPEAALLGRFGDIPIGYYTGTADISIPLYTISEGGVEVPITLSYHSSGIKVADEATWVGLGWSLEPGGAIIQEVRGKPDQEDNLYNPDNPTSTAHLGGTGDEYPTFKAHLNGVGFVTYQTGDCLKGPYCFPFGSWLCDSSSDAQSILNSLLSNNGQPDLYYYNYPGNSGKYYIHPETNAVTFIDKKENISVVNNTVITATDGTIYNFNAGEFSHASYDASGYTNKLTSIQCTNGRTINFTYASENYGTLHYTSNVVLNPVESTVTTPANYTSSTNGTKKRLTQIETSDAYINFIAESRDDFSAALGNNLQRLKSIEIVSKATNKKVKAFLFNYSYFSPSSDYHGKRLKLDSVQEIGYSTNDTIPDSSKPPYTFSYDTSVDLPVKESMAVDLFGYYNGQLGNTTFIPDLRYFDFEHDSRYAVMTTNPPTPRFQYSYTGANRYVDNTKAKAWMLNRITYPTKGYTEFEYEPHTYTNQFLPTVQQHLMAFDTNVKLNSVDNSHYSEAQVHTPLHITESCTLYFRNTFSHGFPTNSSTIISNIFGSTGAYMSAFVKLQKTLNGQTSTIKTWLPSDSGITLTQFTASGTVTIEENVYIEYEPGATYSVYISFPQYTYTQDSNQPYAIAQTYMQVRYIDNTLIDTSTGYGGGFRIKSIKSYSGTGVLTNNKQIAYSGGKLLNRFEPLEALQAYLTNGNCDQWDAHSVLRLRISMSSDDFGLNGGNPIGYDQVEETELVGSVTNGKKIFNYLNGMNTTIKGVPYDPNPFNGLLHKEEVKDRYGSTAKDKTYIYTTLSNASYYGIKIRQHSLGNIDHYDGSDDSVFALPKIEYKYSYLLYPISASWVAPGSAVTNEYLNGTTVTTSESYTYAASGKQKTVTTTYDTGNVDKSIYYYPGEISGAPAIETSMINAKMTGIPVQTEQYTNDVLISSQKNQYANFFSNKIWPAYVFSKKGNDAIAPFEQRVTVDYDNYGNVQQYTLTGGNTPVILLWGYNKTLPIAKIENATAAEVQIALGGTTYIPLYNYTEANMAAIDALRSNTTLAKALITTYSYRPLVGVSTITDPKGMKASYTYDNFGRLTEVRDQYNNLLSQDQYNYKP